MAGHQLVGRMLQHFIYLMLQLKVKIGLHLYFKSYRVNGIENVPRNTPIIFAVNHQNAFLDALIVTCSTQRNPFYLARADFFKNKWAKLMMETIQMMPIYRFRDGQENIKKNEAIIDNCGKLLSDNAALLIFPEGDHAYKYYIRPLKKGVARIAFATESAHNFRLGLSIIPSGIQYEDYSSACNKVLISYGEPVYVSDYKQLYTSDQNEAIRKLLQDIEEKLKALVVDIRPPSEYDDIYAKWKINRSLFNDPVTQLDHDKELIAKIRLHPEKFDDTAAPATPRKRSLKQILLMPVFLYSYLNYIFPNAIVNYLLNHMIRDNRFIGSLRFVLWLFLAPIALTIQSVILFIITKSFAATFTYFIITALFGILTVKQGAVGSSPVGGDR